MTFFHIAAMLQRLFTDFQIVVQNVYHHAHSFRKVCNHLNTTPDDVVTLIDKISEPFFL